MIRSLCLVIFILTNSITIAQNLVINEFMSSNNGFLLDEDGEGNDWIEIYNNSANSINLNGYFLSDKADDLNLWAFPNINLASGDYLLIFASGKNRAAPNAELHTNFSIKAAGEALFLSFNGNIEHSAPPFFLTENTSYGLSSDGGASFVTFNMPTPSASNNSSTGLETVIFSQSGGIYNDVFTLSITGNSAGSTIRYTTDGTKPTAVSSIYSAPLQLDASYQTTENISQIQIAPTGKFSPPSVEDVLKPIVIRAAIFDSQGLVLSEIETHSYFIKTLGIDHFSLPILSICAEHDDLFDNETGIFVPGIHWDENTPDWTGNYYERGIEWEKEAHVEFYDNNNQVGFKQTVGLRTHGGNARRHAQKGMRLYARSAYGKSKFEYPIYASKNITSYNRIVLKPFLSTWSLGGIEDYLSNQYAATMNIDHVATRPVIVYLNGEYWGIYYFQEKIDSDYIEENFGLPEDSFDLLEAWGGYKIAGSSAEFHTMYQFIKDNDLTISSHYNQVAEQIDLESFIDYHLFQIFIGNTDWPGNNLKFWQPKRENGQFRWIFFDGDAGLYRINVNGFDYAINKENEERHGTNPGATIVLRKLMENEIFEKQFFARLEYLLENQLSKNATLPVYNNIISLISNDIHHQIQRFDDLPNYDTWLDLMNTCRNFLLHRSCIIQTQVKKEFDIKLNISNCESMPPILQDFMIIPNPHTGNFKLRFNADNSMPSKILITNSLGQVLKIENKVVLEGNNEIIFNALNLPNGILFIAVVIENQIFRAKMIKLNEN